MSINVFKLGNLNYNSWSCYTLQVGNILDEFSFEQNSVH